jgi:hypothetical protein
MGAAQPQSDTDPLGKMVTAVRSLYPGTISAISSHRLELLLPTAMVSIT